MDGHTSLTECECILLLFVSHFPSHERRVPLSRVNVIEGEPNDTQMTTGNHTVRDIYCVKCGQTLGWKYVRSILYLTPSIV